MYNVWYISVYFKVWRDFIFVKFNKCNENMRQLCFTCNTQPHLMSYSGKGFGEFVLILLRKFVWKFVCLANCVKADIYHTYIIVHKNKIICPTPPQHQHQRHIEHNSNFLFLWPILCVLFVEKCTNFLNALNISSSKNICCTRMDWGILCFVLVLLLPLVLVGFFVYKYKR